MLSVNVYDWSFMSDKVTEVGGLHGSVRVCVEVTVVHTDNASATHTVKVVTYVPGVKPFS